MSGILRLESLTKGNTLKQGDKTPLKYRLFDADGENLNIAGKSAKVRLVYPDFLTIGYEKDGLTVAQDDTVTFTVDRVIPSRIYHVEIIVDDKFIFPSRADEAKFTVYKSSLGTETNIIEIVGKDILVQEVKSQVDAELQPLVTSLESAQQAEIQRASAESSSVSAEAQRKTDHANRSAEIASKADKIVIRNLVKNGDFSDGLTYWTNPADRVITEMVAEGVKITSTGERGRLQQLPLPDTKANDEIYMGAMVKTTDKTVSIADANSPSSYMMSHSGSNEFELLSNTYSRSSGYYYPIVILPIADIVATLQWQMAINLTAIFGAGNEPTKEEMDKLIEVTGYIDGEYALNNKEMLIWTLALIRRNKNAIVALGGA